MLRIGRIDEIQLKELALLLDVDSGNGLAENDVFVAFLTNQTLIKCGIETGKDF